MKPLSDPTTVSALMLPRGSIFQYGFLGGGQFKKYLKKWTFWPKSGGLFKKNPKNCTFHITWGSIQEWGCIRADTVYKYGSATKKRCVDKIIHQKSHKPCLSMSNNHQKSSHLKFEVKILFDVLLCTRKFSNLNYWTIFWEQEAILKSLCV